MTKDFKTNNNYQISELKAGGIDFFKKVANIIQSFNIDVWIEYGSLLGYVRHQGLIPWDSEFDLGIIKSNWNTAVEEKLKEEGFILIHDASRVKIKQPNISVGIFTIDIHLHDVEGDYTKLLFGELCSSKTEKWEKIYWFFEMTSKSTKKIPIRYLSIMKSISSKLNILEPSILKKKFSIHRGKYNHEKSFLVTIDNFKIKDFFYENIKPHRRLILSFVYLMPSFLHNYISKLLLAKIVKPNYIDKYQKMPLDIYLDLEVVIYCGVKIKAPVNKEKFLKTVYGDDWQIPKMNFSRQQMKNLSKK